MEILELVDKLETLASSATKLPFSDRALVASDKIMELVDQMRVAVPDDVAKAQEVLSKREELLNQGLGEARRIRASAESEYHSRVEENQLVKEAQKRAGQIVEEAQQKAQRVLAQADRDAEGRRSAADQYAQEALYKLEQEISRILVTIRHGIEMLERPQEAGVR